MDPHTDPLWTPSGPLKEAWAYMYDGGNKGISVFSFVTLYNVDR